MYSVCEGYVLTCTRMHIYVLYIFSLPLSVCLLSAFGNGAHFLQLKTEIEAMVLTHFTLILFQALTTHLFVAAARGGLRGAGAVRADRLGWKLAGL